MTARALTLPELSLLAYMLRDKPQAGILLSLLPTAKVEELNESGSLRFTSHKPARRLGEIVAELWYQDEDGVPVLARLYLDTEGDLYELDNWKTDSSALRRIPNL